MNSPEEMRKDIADTLRDYAGFFDECDTVGDLSYNMADLIYDVADLNSDLTDAIKRYGLDREIH